MDCDSRRFDLREKLSGRGIENRYFNIGTAGCNKGKRFVVSLSAPPILNDVMTYNIRIMSVLVLKFLIENS